MAIDVYCQYRCHAGFEKIKSDSGINLSGYSINEEVRMEFIENTINWCTREIFEGKMIAPFGISVTIIAGIGCYVFLGGAWGRAIGLALILFGFSELFIDHFSEEGAETYHQQIVRALK